MRSLRSCGAGHRRLWLRPSSGASLLASKPLPARLQVLIEWLCSAFLARDGQSTRGCLLRQFFRSSIWK
ncbi:unnamed protein product, partial [Symbiodinium microadriaticum]